MLMIYEEMLGKRKQATPASGSRVVTYSSSLPRRAMCWIDDDFFPKAEYIYWGLIRHIAVNGLLEMVIAIIARNVDHCRSE